MKKKRGKAGWYTGHNSTCRRHIASAHYEEYTARCEKDQITQSKQAIPRKVLEAREQEAKQQGLQRQSTLDNIAKKITLPTSFLHASILKSVVVHVVCGDQVRTIHRLQTYNG